MRPILYIFSVILSVLSSFDASTCSCRGTEPLKHGIERSDAVFKGTPIFAEKVRISLLPSSTDTVEVSMARVTFAVEKVFKGELLTDTAVILTGLGGGDCGFPFIFGKVYCVFAYKQSIIESAIRHKFKSIRTRKVNDRKEYLTTNICTLTGQYSAEFEEMVMSELNGKANGS